VFVFRIGVILENDRAHQFWRKHGFKEVGKTDMADNKKIIIYEKSI
jgi:predicted GNAT superfamily acetyltransferase